MSNRAETSFKATTRDIVGDHVPPRIRERALRVAENGRRGNRYRVPSMVGDDDTVWVEGILAAWIFPPREGGG